jgi:hypothetical protein
MFDEGTSEENDMDIDFKDTTAVIFYFFYFIK